MNGTFFLISLFSISFFFQLIRSPYLILENGGGAFLILFFLSLHLFCFPLLVAEKTLDKKIKKLDLSSLIYLKNFSRLRGIDSILVVMWLAVRFLVLLSLLWFFLYLGCKATLYSLSFLKLNGDLRQLTVGHLNDLDSQINPYTAVLFSIFVSSLFLWVKKKFFNLSVRLVLPFIIGLFLVLFFKNVLSIHNYVGLKTLLYPDFSALNSKSLINILGHGLGCLLIGIGFYDHSLFKNLKKDPIDIFIQIIIQTLFLSFFVGLLALPLIEQAGEVPYGAYFIFDILPRWLSYGEYGQYYSFLYFLSITYLCLYLSVMLVHLFSKNIALVGSLMGKSWKRVMKVLFILTNSAAILLLQEKMSGWQGQSFLLRMDNIIFNVLMPLLALLMIWFVFRYTNSKERAEVFSQQQVFFHNRVFFRLWQKLTLYFVTGLIVTAWVLDFPLKP